MAKIFADLTPLKNANFRSLFLGQWISNLGAGVNQIAFPYQMYLLTQDNVLVGLIGLAQLIPTALTAFFGGWAADRYDRKKIVMIAEAFSALVMFTAAFLTTAGQMTPAWLFVLTGCQGFLNGFHRPSLEALTPQILPVGEVAAAAALSGFRMTSSMIMGPAIGGILVAQFGVASTCWIDGISYLISVFFLTRVTVPVLSDLQAERRNAFSWTNIVGGIRYAAKEPVLLGTYFVDMAAMVFTYPFLLFPAIGLGFGSAGSVGVLHSSVGVGAFVASVGSGWIHRKKRHGKVIAIAAMVWTLGIFSLSYAPTLMMAAVALFFAGYADAVSGFFRQTVWNQTIATEYRGRLAAVEMMSYLTGPLVGAALLGFAADRWSPALAFRYGSILAFVGVVLFGVGNRTFWKYESKI